MILGIIGPTDLRYGKLIMSFGKTSVDSVVGENPGRTKSGVPNQKTQVILVHVPTTTNMNSRSSKWVRIALVNYHNKVSNIKVVSTPSVYEYRNLFFRI